MEQVNIEIQRKLYPTVDFGYVVNHIQGDKNSEAYVNRATEVNESYILTEQEEKPFCIVNNMSAADNALYYLATEEAKKRLELLGTPRIIDGTN